MATPTLTPAPPTDPSQLDQWYKVHAADYLRLSADNQRTLDRTAAADQFHRVFAAWNSRRLAAKSAGQEFTEPPPSGPEFEADPMQISIDSPTTINHHHVTRRPAAATQPAPVPPAPARPRESGEKSPTIGALTKAGMLGAVLASGGAGAMLTHWLQPEPAAVERPAEPDAVNDTDTQYSLRAIPHAD